MSRTINAINALEAAVQRVTSVTERACFVAGADWAHAQYEQEVERYRKALATAQRQLMPVRKMLFKTTPAEFKKYGDAINSACNALDVIDNALKVEDEHD